MDVYDEILATFKSCRMRCVEVHLSDVDVDTLYHQLKAKYHKISEGRTEPKILVRMYKGKVLLIKSAS